MATGNFPDDRFVSNFYSQTTEPCSHITQLALSQPGSLFGESSWVEGDSGKVIVESSWVIGEPSWVL